ncbi:MAG: hypothetical protein Q4C71_01920 [Microbacteriaceae bacterium]|nr:hypothetical protein [Microbacteriaceae bacterium]
MVEKYKNWAGFIEVSALNGRGFFVIFDAWVLNVLFLAFEVLEF